MSENVAYLRAAAPANSAIEALTAFRCVRSQ